MSLNPLSVLAGSAGRRQARGRLADHPSLGLPSRPGTTVDFGEVAVGSSKTRKILLPAGGDGAQVEYELLATDPAFHLPCGGQCVEAHPNALLLRFEPPAPGQRTLVLHWRATNADGERLETGKICVRANGIRASAGRSDGSAVNLPQCDSASRLDDPGT